jgi:hypothetical protein
MEAFRLKTKIRVTREISITPSSRCSNTMPNNAEITSLRKSDSSTLILITLMTSMLAHLPIINSWAIKKCFPMLKMIYNSLSSTAPLRKCLPLTLQVESVPFLLMRARDDSC